jgi:hypothetical protein
MPDPVWTAQYNFANTPENNGFTRIVTGNPIITLTTGGPTANRKVTIDSTNGEVFFVTSNIPSFNSEVGVTCECSVSSNGVGDAGFEVTFLDLAFGLNVYSNSVLLTLCADPPNSFQEVVINTPPNTSQTLFRVIIDSSKKISIYRVGVLITGPHQMLPCIKPFQRFLWWSEGGGTQVFNGMKYYLGGAVAPG